MDLGETVERIVEMLAEHDADAREQIVAVVAALGETAALELLGETQRIERDGGLLVADGSRRRAPGGVFLHLARRRLPARERNRIFHGAPTAAARVAPFAPRSETHTAVTLDMPSDRSVAVAAAGPAPAADAQGRRRIVHARGVAAEAVPLAPANDGARRAKKWAANRYPASRDGLARRDRPARTNEHAKQGANAREQARMPDSDSFERAVAKVAADLLPMLSEAMFAHIRGALLAGRSLGEPALTSTSTSSVSVRDEAEVQAPRVASQSRRVELRNGPARAAWGAVQQRLLFLLARRAGMTAGALALALYGEDTRETRARVTTLTWRLRKAGVIRGGGREGFELARS